MKTQPAAVEPRSESRELPPLARVVIEHVQPQVDGGRFPIKRTVGEEIHVSADVFADGHDQLAAVLKHRHIAHAPHAGATRWNEVPLTSFGNDSWGASFIVTEPGDYEYTIEAWVDRFASWLAALTAKAEAGQDVASDLLEGAELIQQAAPVRLKPDTPYEMLTPDTPYEMQHVLRVTDAL